MKNCFQNDDGDKNLTMTYLIYLKKNQNEGDVLRFANKQKKFTISDSHQYINTQVLDGLDLYDSLFGNHVSVHKNSDGSKPTRLGIGLAYSLAFYGRFCILRRDHS